MPGSQHPCSWNGYRTYWTIPTVRPFWSSRMDIPISISAHFHYGWRSYTTAVIPVWKIDALTGEKVWQTDIHLPHGQGCVRRRAGHPGLRKKQAFRLISYPSRARRRKYGHTGRPGQKDRQSGMGVSERHVQLEFAGFSSMTGRQRLCHLLHLRRHHVPAGRAQRRGTR